MAIFISIFITILKVELGMLYFLLDGAILWPQSTYLEEKLSTMTTFFWHSIVTLYPKSVNYYD
jgi:hypothetical protein